MKLFESSSERGTSGNAFLQAGIHRIHIFQNISRVGSRTQCPSATSGFGFALASLMVLLEERPPACLTAEEASDGIWL